MEKEEKTCQNCRSSFTVEPEDFGFYEKIKVPPPERCPKCRLINRLVFRNERMLYKRKCDLTGQEIISQYSPDTPYPVYETREYFKREWNLPSLGYDQSRSFLEQLQELRLKTPRRSLLTDLQSIENGSIYQNAASRNKNCYMVSASGDNEDCFYSNNVDYCKSVVDGLGVRQTQFAYDSIDCMGCSNIFFSEECRDCVNGYFLYECKYCTDCFGCAHLRHKSYCWFNEQLSPEEYQRRIKDFKDNFNADSLALYREKLEDLSNNYPRKFAHTNSDSTSTCTGDYMVGCKNVRDSFNIVNCEDCKYCIKLIASRNCYDVNDWGDPGELCYESITVGKGASGVMFSTDCWPECRDLQYCDSCMNCANCFGCVGMKDASYCVLNKKYSKQDYEELVNKIIKDMQNRGEYGRFMPMEFSSFAYNESIAQEYFPLIKAEALAQGYIWKDAAGKDYHITRMGDKLPLSIKEVGDEITQEIIGCVHEGECSDQCTTAFRITSEELGFYRNFGLPLPHLCFNCRHTQRSRYIKRCTYALWKRQCQCLSSEATAKPGFKKNTTSHSHGDSPCPNEFETSYAPDRPEIVYCEECYNAEVA